MVDVHIVTFVRRIALTLDSEIDCGECSHLSAGYAEAVLTGKDGVDRWTAVKTHLAQCPICAEEFQGLYTVARVELEGSWPTIAWLLDRLTELGLNA